MNTHVIDKMCNLVWGRNNFQKDKNLRRISD